MWTSADAEAYTYILYLDLPAEFVAQRRQQDHARPDRLQLSESQLREWQDHEKSKLLHLCREHDILFSLIQPGNIDRVVRLLNDFRNHDEAYNLVHAKDALDDICLVQDKTHRLETMLVFVADKTLAAEDAGTLVWTEI